VFAEENFLVFAFFANPQKVHNRPIAKVFFTKYSKIGEPQKFFSAIFFFTYNYTVKVFQKFNLSCSKNLWFFVVYQHLKHFLENLSCFPGDTITNEGQQREIIHLSQKLMMIN